MEQKSKIFKMTRRQKSAGKILHFDSKKPRREFLLYVLFLFILVRAEHCLQLAED
jgi:hypothetical protein